MAGYWVRLNILVHLLLCVPFDFDCDFSLPPPVSSDFCSPPSVVVVGITSSFSFLIRENIT